MDLDYLREFVVLAQTSNFLEAADILYSSQSTLSKHLKCLESELGVPLFERTTRKVVLNKYGQMYLPYAKQIVELQDKSYAELQNSLDVDLDVLTLGTIPSLAQYNITDVLVKYKKNRPKSTLNVMQAGSGELKDMLRQHKCELAFIGDFDEVDEDIVRVPYATDKLVAVLPSTHPLAKKKSILLTLLANEDFILIDKQTIMYRHSVRICQQSGFEPRVALTDAKYDNIIDLVIKGMGVALMMKRHAIYNANPKIAIVDIDPTVTTQISLCYLEGAELSESAKFLLNCIKT